MSLQVENNIEIQGDKYRKLSCDELLHRQSDWYFEYTTLNTNRQDWTVYPNIPVDYNKADYPIGTIFLDSEPYSIYMSSSISNVVIDNTPPVFVMDDTQYMVFNSDFICSFTFESDIPLDIAQLRIYCGNEQQVLYESLRKNSEIIKTEYLAKISVAKNNNLYTVKFTVSQDYDITKLDEGLTIQVWDLAANTTSYTTTNEWHNYKTYDDCNDLLPLEIEFTDHRPVDMIVNSTVVGEVHVKVINLNTDLFSIIPTIELSPDSVGHIDTKTITYDKTTGVLTFIVNGIDKSGGVIVDAWLTINNPEIASYVKDATFAEAIFKSFYRVDDGRKYKFANYKPSYISDENYGEFVTMVETFLNSCQESLSTGNRIGQLEKIARIGNFNNIDSIENPLMEYYKDEFGFEITPNLMEYLNYLYYKPEILDDAGR